MVRKPYEETNSVDGFTIRTFLPETKSEELKWHRDDEDRLIDLLEPTDWLLQIDNELPVEFPERVLIERGTWHRVIKGGEKLVVRITKMNGSI